jgi:hypothetical protein
VFGVECVFAVGRRTNDIGESALPSLPNLAWIGIDALLLSSRAEHLLRQFFSSGSVEKTTQLVVSWYKKYANWAVHSESTATNVGIGISFRTILVRCRCQSRSVGESLRRTPSTRVLGSLSMFPCRAGQTF